MNLGFPAIILAAAIFGSAGVFVKCLGLPPACIAGLRLFIPAAILFGCSPVLRQRLLGSPNHRLLIASGFTAFRILLWVLSLTLAAISKAVIMLYTWPIFFTLLSIFYLHERVSAQKIVLLLIGFAGILLVFSPAQFSLAEAQTLGLLLMLVVAVINAVVLTIFKKELDRLSHYEVLLYDNIVGALIFLPLLFYQLPQTGAAQIGLGLVYGFTIGFIGYSLLYYGLARVKASTASILCYVEVVSACCFGVFFFGEEITWNMLAGGAMILAAAGFVRNT